MGRSVRCVEVIGMGCEEGKDYRWDEDSNPREPGFVVRVQRKGGDGSYEDWVAPSPGFYHLKRSASKSKVCKMVRETRKWESSPVDI